MFAFPLRRAKKGSDFRPVFVTIIPIIEIWVPNFILDFTLWPVTISIVDNYLEHWELRRWESKITKTTVTLRDKVEQKNTPWPSASTPGYKPDRIPAQGHHEPGLVKAALPRGQREKKTSLEATQISAAAEWIHKLWSIHGTECYTVVKRMTCCVHRVDSLGMSCKGKKAEGRWLHTEWPNYLKIKITQN